MSAPRHFKYFAFISYSRKDEKFAKRLQHFLTGFKLPTRLCKQYPDKPKRLRPIYRDKTDLDIDELKKALQKGLNSSRYLIVVCSENSAKPNKKGKNWIDAEVRAFISLNEENKSYVIPVLLREKDGPSSNSCTPPAVQELGLLAADVSDKGEERVFNAVAAKMLGLAPDELWDWWSRAQLRKKRIRIGLGIIAALPTVFAGWTAWDYCTPHYRYYADYVESFNIPKGIHRLSREKTRHMESFYRFTTQYRQLDRVDNINSAGDLVSSAHFPGHEGRPVSFSLAYDNKQMATQHTCYDEHCRPVKKLIIDKRHIDIIDNRPAEAAQWPGATLFSEKQIGRLEVERDEKGFVDKERYLTSDGKACKNRDGAWGCKYERDKKGRVISITYLDEKGTEPKDNKNGIAQIGYEYDNSAGQVCRITYKNAKEQYVHKGDKETYTDEYIWEKGNMISFKRLGKEGTPIDSTTYAYYGDGRKKAESYLNKYGKPCTCKDGYAKKVFTYDSSGSITESYYDTQGAPCTDKEGHTGKKTEYDRESSKPVVTYYSGNDKQPEAESGTWDWIIPKWF